MWKEMNLTILGVKVILHFAGLLLASLANIKLPAILISHVQSHGLNEEMQDTNVSRSEGTPVDLGKASSVWKRPRDATLSVCRPTHMAFWMLDCICSMEEESLSRSRVSCYAKIERGNRYPRVTIWNYRSFMDI